MNMKSHDKITKMSNKLKSKQKTKNKMKINNNNNNNKNCTLRAEPLIMNYEKPFCTLKVF